MALGSTTRSVLWLIAREALQLVAAIAVSIPAYRAARVDPLFALRHD